MIVLLVGEQARLSAWERATRQGGYRLHQLGSASQALEVLQGELSRGSGALALVEPEAAAWAAELADNGALVIAVIPDGITASPIALLDSGAANVLSAPWTDELCSAQLLAFERRLSEQARRAHVERALRESEERFRRLAEATFEGTCIHSGGTIVDANDRMTELFGYSREELIGKSALDLASPESRPTVAEHITSGSTASYEGMGLRRDGSRFFAELRGRPAPWGGRSMRVTSIRDISERKAAEAALRLSEERLSATLNSIGDAVIATDVSARVTRMNPVAEALTGWKLDEARGMPLEEVFVIRCEGTLEPVESPAVRVLREGVVVGLANHTLLLSRDGTSRPIADSGAPIRGSSGEVEGVVLVFRDTTDERAAAMALEQSESTLRAFYDSAPLTMGLLELGDDGELTIVSCNAAAGRHLGLEPELLAGRTLRSISSSEANVSLWHEQAAEALRSGGPVRFEYVAARGDGRTVRLVTLCPIRTDEGPQRRLCMVVEDVSERRQLEARLQLADRLVSVGTLAAGVAHEINNPLTYVLGSLSLAGRALDSPQPEPARLERARAAIAQASEGADRVKRIVRDLKLFSRVEDQPRKGPVNLRDVLDSAVQMAWNEIRHRARLVRNYAEVPVVEANDAQLGQVFLNLLINAAQAIPAGHADDNEIRLSLTTTASGEAVVEVVDTGSGIDPLTLGRIFDPFFTTKPVGVGTGLGLSICHGIVSSLGGRIQVESSAGQGARFRVVLPSAGRARGGESLSPPPPPSRRRGRVVVVDDEPQVAQSIGQLLEETHDVSAFTSAKMVLAALEAGETFDVLVCDLMMPQITGMQLYDQLLARGESLASRVIFLTGGAFTPEARAFLERVRAPRLDKPIDVEALLSAVQGLLDAAILPPE